MGSYNLSSTGVIALLMKNNQEEKNDYKYTHIIHGAKNTSFCQRHTFSYTPESGKKRIMVVNEEENPRDAIEQDCCKLYSIMKDKFDDFFTDDEVLKLEILKTCTRPSQGLGYSHCSFLEKINKKSNGPFWLYHEEKHKKKCLNRKIL